MSTIECKTPDTCVICGKPSIGSFVVSESRQYYAVTTQRKKNGKPGGISWRLRGWGANHAKLCVNHARDLGVAVDEHRRAHGKMWVPPPKASVSSARVRQASYQAQQMDHGQLSYWSRYQWAGLHNGSSDKLTSAVNTNIPWGPPQDVPLLPATVPSNV